MLSQQDKSESPDSPRAPLDALTLTDALSYLEMPGDRSAAALSALHEEFLRYGYVRLPQLLTGEVLRLFKAEMTRLEAIAMRRAFDMPGYNTPRKLSVLGGRAIRANSPDIYGMYHHHSIRHCVERITGRRIYSCRHADEFMVTNFLQTAGDTHGWHLDDPPFALVIFAEVPGLGCGGEVEMVANWTDHCRRMKRRPDADISDLLDWAFQNGLVESHRHEEGDAYLLRADINLHRVVPLKTAGERRWVVNLAFQQSPDTDYGDTASLLYGASQDGESGHRNRLVDAPYKGRS